MANQDIVQLKIELTDIDPPIWRRVQVPADFTLRGLHGVIQVVFDWLDYHLHEFEVGDQRYGAEIADDDFGSERVESDDNVELADLVERGVKRFVYTYDFGDGWEHLITVEKVLAPQDGAEYPILVDGARQAPPEDCGGPPGFEMFLEAMQDEDHEEHDHLLDWYGEPFDPLDMRLEHVEARLEEIRASRRKGRAKGRRGRSSE